jgi:hypothetical protein
MQRVSLCAPAGSKNYAEIATASGSISGYQGHLLRRPADCSLACLLLQPSEFASAAIQSRDASPCSVASMQVFKVPGCFRDGMCESHCASSF